VKTAKKTKDGVGQDTEVIFTAGKQPTPETTESVKYTGTVNKSQKSKKSAAHKTSKESLAVSILSQEEIDTSSQEITEPGKTGGKTKEKPDWISADELK
jgi:hypothetical protein